MADETSKKDLPTATVLPSKQASARGVLIDPTVLVAGGIVALVGVGVLAAFMWMVPGAAKREAIAACRGMRGFEKVNPALCPSGMPCVAPDFAALDHNNKPVKLSDFRGKVVLVNFWASWCGVCKAEKPSLVGAMEELGGDDFQVISLASDKSWAPVLVATIQSLNRNAQLPQANADGQYNMQEVLDAYRKALPNGVPFKVFLDPPEGDNNIGAIASAWGLNKVPDSVLVDRKGNIRAYFVNKRSWDSDVAQTCLRSFIDEDS